MDKIELNCIEKYQNRLIIAKANGKVLLSPIGMEWELDNLAKELAKIMDIELADAVAIVYHDRWGRDCTRAFFGEFGVYEKFIFDKPLPNGWESLPIAVMDKSNEVEYSK